MRNILDKLTGSANITDQMIVSDLLMATKTAMASYSLAITGTTDSTIRNTLTRYQNDAISYHEKLTKYMLTKDYYHPYDMEKQIAQDIENARAAIKLLGD